MSHKQKLQPWINLSYWQQMGYASFCVCVFNAITAFREKHWVNEHIWFSKVSVSFLKFSEIDDFFLLPLRYGMLYPIRKQWRLFLQHHIKKKQLKSSLNAPYVNGSGRKMALLWMTCQLFASSFSPSLLKKPQPLKLLIKKNG